MTQSASVLNVLTINQIQQFVISHLCHWLRSSPGSTCASLLEFVLPGLCSLCYIHFYFVERLLVAAEVVVIRCRTSDDCLVDRGIASRTHTTFLKVEKCWKVNNSFVPLFRCLDESVQASVEALAVGQIERR